MNFYSLPRSTRSTTAYYSYNSTLTTNYNGTGSINKNVYGDMYRPFEIPGTKFYEWKGSHHGLVLISDGKGSGRPARLELTRDSLAVQVPIALAPDLEDNTTDCGLRNVYLRRQKDGGLGLSIKGGSDGSVKLPILISKIFKDQAADQTGQLFVGDAIIEVNGTNIEHLTHDEVVSMLREAGEEVRLVVRHYTHMAPYLRRSMSFKRARSGSNAERISDYGTGSWKASRSALKSPPSEVGSVATSNDDAPEGWKVLVKIPLPMALLTRYLWGTDKIRPNAFEVRAVDGTSTGVVHCEDGCVLDQWVKNISTNITQLNNKSIKMSNKFLHPSELIVYLGWISERQQDGVEGELWQTWNPRFLILKGSDVCFFDSPPLNSEDLNKCVYMYKVYETAFKEVKEHERLDHRDCCYWVETANQAKHYISVESRHQLNAIEGAWNRATYYAVSKMQSKTFACNYDGRPSGLVLDLRQGFSLYDIPSKRYNWQYRFSSLKTSSDDGKMRLQLIFHNLKSNTGEDTKDLDCADLYPLVYTLHAFYVARIMSVDPDFLKLAK